MRTTKKLKPRKRGTPPACLQSAPPISIAIRLDVLAGIELQHGHHAAAEHLARRAEALREVRP